MRVLFAPLLVGLLGVACANDAALEPVRLRIEPGSVQGQSVLGRVATIELAVYAEDTGVVCTESGEVTGTKDAGDPLASVELTRQGCPAGAAFCGSVTLEQSEVARVFAAIGKDSEGGVFALACSTATLDQAEISVDLQFRRALAPARCGNQQIEAPETCDFLGPACDKCDSQELVVSTGSAQNATVDGDGSDKLEPALLVTPRAIVATYTDKSSASTDGDIAMRVLGPQLDAVTSPPSARAGFFLASPSVPGQPREGVQGASVACLAEDALLVAFESTDADVDVKMQAFDGVSYAARGNPVLVTGEGEVGTSGDQRAPALACTNGGKGLVVWRDAGSGRVRGRSFTAPDTLGRVQDIGGPGDGTRVVVARRSGGWVVAWESGRAIRLRVVGEDGTPSGGELTLDGDAPRAYPSLAALEDGRFALSYLEGESPARVLVQRYDADGRRTGEAVTVSEKDAECTSPTLAGAPNAGGAYAVVWLERTAVRARWLGGDRGFLLGPISGLEDPFDVSRSAVDKNTPVAAASSSALIVGWHDVERGIVLRSLPLAAR